jgi:hypothetical protein
MKSQGNMAPPKVNNHTKVDMIKSEEDKNLNFWIKRMIRKFNEMKEENIHKQL